MLEAVRRHGYAATTVGELVALAGVSKSTFYEHFADKRDCFLATFDEIVRQVSERIGEAYRSPGDFRERLRAALACFMELAVADPAAASLAVVESLTLGAAGVEHRERGSEAFELMIHQSFEQSPEPREVSEVTIRAIVAGIRGVTYRRFREGKRERLPGCVDELIDWALGYQRPDSEAVRRAMEAAEIGSEEPEAGGVEELGWEEPPDSRRSRAELSQRERIIRAAAQVATEKGYAALSIPAISATAGTSNQTFYEHFTSKQEAFLAAFGALAERVLVGTAKAFEEEGNRPEAIGAAVRALLEHVVSDGNFTRIAFFELTTAGPVALDYADAQVNGFTAFLRPPALPSGIGEPVGEVVLEAIGSGIWAVIQHEIAHGRLEALPELAPEITRIALAPFGAK
jgi:AcrR family transcriptional regulator